MALNLLPNESLEGEYGLRQLWGSAMPITRPTSLSTAPSTPGSTPHGGPASSDVFGYQVVTRTFLLDGSQIECRYAHMLGGLYVSEGEQVTLGQKPGKPGSSGQAAGDHLHFSVNVNGSYVNPTGLIEWPMEPELPPSPGTNDWTPFPDLSRAIRPASTGHTCKAAGMR